MRVGLVYKEKKVRIQYKVHTIGNRARAGGWQNKRPIPERNMAPFWTQGVVQYSCTSKTFHHHSHHVASAHTTFVSAYDAHRVSRRHLGFGRFLPWIEGPVLVAVRGAQPKGQGNKQKQRSLCVSAQTLEKARRKQNEGSPQYGIGNLHSTPKDDVLFQSDIERGGQERA